MIKISPDEVIERLSTLGVKWSRSTLLRAVKDELGPAPKTGAGGRGYGRWADYDADAYAEFYASHILLKVHKIETFGVVVARKSVLNFCEEYFMGRWDLKSHRNGQLNRIMWEKMFGMAKVVYATPNAVRWWELKQAASSTMAKEYSDLLLLKDDSSITVEVPDAIQDAKKWIPIFKEILTGLEQIAQLDCDSNIKLDAWLRLLKENPKLRAQVRAGLLADCRNLSDMTIQFLADETLPEARETYEAAMARIYYRE